MIAFFVGSFRFSWLTCRRQLFQGATTRQKADGHADGNRRQLYRRNTGASATFLALFVLVVYFDFLYMCGAAERARVKISATMDTVSTEGR